MKRLPLVILACFLVLSACVEPEPPVVQGTITATEFKPAHWEGGYESVYTYGYHCGIDYEGEYTCGFRPGWDRVWEDQHTYVQDAWYFTLRDCTRNEKDEMKCRDGRVNVDSETFHSYKVGNHYPEPR